MPLVSGTKLGPYEIVGPLGTGGMGEVYRARDMRPERIVATKILPAHFSNDPVRKRRFEREGSRSSGRDRLPRDGARGRRDAVEASPKRSFARRSSVACIELDGKAEQVIPR